MAAYAAVVSLMNIMEQIRDHPRLPTLFDPIQIESLGENLDFFLGFIEGYSVQGTGSKEMDPLEMQIASAAHAAEDVIESHVVDQIRAGFDGTSPSFLIDLQKIIEDMSVIKELLAKFKEERLYKDEQSKDQQPPAAPSRPPISMNTTMVGFDDVFIQLLDWVTGGRSALEIVPIVGLGGIGKTTLARNAYEHLFIIEHFDCRAWANVSQEMNVRRVLLELLSCLGQSTDQLVEYPENELGEELFKHLTGRRYLIVLDDMWDISSWDLIRYFCPDNYNGSRIIVTTRLSGLAAQLNSSGVEIKFLHEDESWALFCKTVFGDEHCPPELEEIGKMIVKYCRGLPLAITVIGGLLRTSTRTRTRRHWGYVAENIGSILNSEDDYQLQKVLMLSYDALPTYLKPCFLYMGIFPEDHEFRVSRVIKLFVAEGFLKPMVGRTLEDVGESCIQELIDRSLILVSSKGSKGKVKTCKIHDIMRDLCLRIVEKERFLSLMRPVGTPQVINSDRQFVVREKHIDPQFFHAMESTLLARSLICKSPAAVSFKSRLLRVLIEVYSDSLNSTFQQVNLRFLAYEKTRAPIGWIPTYELPSSMSQLWNVQTLIIDKKVELVVAPPEIWQMRQLRHLDFYRIYLPEPPASDDKDDSALPNLQTLGTVLNYDCSEEVCKRMPNIKKLRVFYDDFSGEGQKIFWYCIYNVSLFVKLESLYYCFHQVPNRDDLLKNLKFPVSLRKLILQDCELHWDDLSTIGWLPLLEVLKLKRQSVRGTKWNTVEEGFRSLRILEIDSCHLIYWNANASHFPWLKKLVLVRLYKLDEIPYGIGDIPTLEEICVVECSISAAISAARIRVEQEEIGNEDLHVRVRFRKEEELAEFTAKVELQGLTSYHLQIDRL